MLICASGGSTVTVADVMSGCSRRRAATLAAQEPQVIPLMGKLWESVMIENKTSALALRVESPLILHTHEAGKCYTGILLEGGRG